MSLNEEEMIVGFILGAFFLIECFFILIVIKITSVLQEPPKGGFYSTYFAKDLQEFLLQMV